MKKVLLVATVQSHICQFHRPLVEVLREKEWKIDVAARDNLAEKNGLQLDFVDNVFDIPFCRSPFKVGNIKAYKQLKKVIKAENYDVIHCNTPVGGILARIAAKGARKKGTRVYYTAHGFHFYKGAPLLNWLIYYPIERIFSNMTDKLITIVEEDYQFSLKKFHCPVYRIHGVGVDEKKFYPLLKDEKHELREKMGFSDEQNIILCIGELLANKNQQMIIRAMPEIIEKNPNTILLLAGNGPKHEELEGLINSLNLQKHVILLGYITNIHEYHKLSDILVSCSIREGLPLNVIESMMIGNPVVITDNRGHRELIDQGKNGMLIATYDEKKLILSVNNLLLFDEKYEAYACNAKKFAVKYSSQMVKEELSEIYEL